MLSTYLKIFLLSVVTSLTAPGQTVAPVKPDLTAADPIPSLKLAKKLYERLAGVKASVDSSAIKQMQIEIEKGNRIGAAQIAINDPHFYNVTIKLMALKLSTRDETIKTPLNDFTASWIGLVRDDLDARELLTGNFYYMADPAKIAAITPAAAIRSDLIKDVLTSNNHFEDLESKNINLFEVLTKISGQQLAVGDDKNLTITANLDPAGLITSRTFMTSHAIAGTNRRPVEFTFREFMCLQIQEWADANAPDLRIGTDIDRFPGGDHQKFETSCKGCHTQMDSFRGAFAYWDANGERSFYSEGKVNPKYTRNKQVFPDGYTAKDDSFLNNSNIGSNAKTIGWRTSTNTGNGVGQFGKIVANSQRFSECMTKRVFEASCKREFNITKNMAVIKKYASQFEAQGYSFKKLFGIVATSPECLGE